eukprot:4372960-Prymnesium_polylepis.1
MVSSGSAARQCTRPNDWCGLLASGEAFGLSKRVTTRSLGVGVALTQQKPPMAKSSTTSDGELTAFLDALGSGGAAWPLSSPTWAWHA